MNMKFQIEQQGEKNICEITGDPVEIMFYLSELMISRKEIEDILFTAVEATLCRKGAQEIYNFCSKLMEAYSTIPDSLKAND